MEILVNSFILYFLRIIFISILLFGSLIHWHWKASIISDLSVDIPSIPFRSAEELVDSSYQITMEKDTALHQAFESAKSDLFKQIWDTKFRDKEKSLKNTVEEMMNVVKSGQYALLYPEVQTLEQYKDCSLTDPGFVFFNFDNAFAFPKDSPFKDVFNHALLKMIESGELDKIKTKYKSIYECDGSSGRSLGISNVGFAFAVFAIGLVLCTVVLGMEILRKKSMPHKTQI